MNLSDYKYINLSERTGIIADNIMNILELNNKMDIFTHVKAVSVTNAVIAGQYGLDRQKCELCGLLHDISIVIKSEDMLAYAIKAKLPLDEAERKYPFLLHQRISRILTQDYFKITDADILSAVECHTTLKANPSKYDMSLFIADKLSWDQK